MGIWVEPNFKSYNGNNGVMAEKRESFEDYRKQKSDEKFDKMKGTEYSSMFKAAKADYKFDKLEDAEAVRTFAYKRFGIKSSINSSNIVVVGKPAQEGHTLSVKGTAEKLGRLEDSLVHSFMKYTKQAYNTRPILDLEA